MGMLPRNADGSLVEQEYRIGSASAMQKVLNGEVGDRDQAIAKALRDAGMFGQVPRGLVSTDGIDPDVKKAYAHYTDDVRGMAAARQIRAIATARLDGGTALSVLKSWSKEKNPLDGSIEKALLESTVVDGGALVAPQFMPEVVELLRAEAVIRSLGPTIVPLVEGNMSIPRQTGASSAAYVGETQAATASQETTDLIQLNSHELVAVVPVSNKLLRHSGIAADTFIRNDLVKVLGLKEDITFIRAIGSQASPKGIRYWVDQTNNVKASVYTGDSAGTVLQITSDVQTAMTGLANANVPMNPKDLAWIFTPRTEWRLKTLVTSLGVYPFREEMVEEGTFFGLRYKTTTQIPNNLSGSYGTNQSSEIYLVHMPDCVIGEDLNTMIEVFPNATYKDSGGNVVSGVNSMQTIIRSVSAHDFALRHNVSAFVLTGVVYGVAV